MKKLALLILSLVLFCSCSVKVYKVELPSAYPLMQVPYEELIDEAEKDNETPWEKNTPGGPKYYI